MVSRNYAPLPLSDDALACIESVAAAHLGRREVKARPEALTPDDSLARAVRELSAAYTRERAHLSARDATRDALHARLRFFLPRDLPKVFGPLDERLRDPRSSLATRPTLRLLDVGSGLGATALGVARWLRLRKLPVERLEVVALERNAEASRIFSELARKVASLPDEFTPMTLETRAADLERAHFREAFDLVTFGFVLNELLPGVDAAARTARKLDLLVQAARALAPGGALIVLEPALRDTTRELMMLRDAIVARGAAPYVTAPCLHTAPCPMLPSERDWCHQELAYALPSRLAAVARAASLRFEGLRYASLTLANEPPSAHAPNAYRVVSDPLSSKGKLELFGCNARGYVRLTRLERKANALNAAFAEARRGDVLEVATSEPRIDEHTAVTKR